MVDGVELCAPLPGRNLPPRAFTSRAVFELEQRAIFARSWVHVADTSDLAAPGSYVAAQIGATPVLVVRDRDGALRGYLNACRHRGAQLLEGKGTCAAQIKCPYHAWSYALDGKLHGVPYRDDFAHCDLSTTSLVPVRLGTVGPLVFACLDQAAPPLAEWVGELPASLARAGVERWQLAWEASYELDANWKLFVENANDGYHVPFVHDILTDAIVIDPATSQTVLEPHSAYSWARLNPNYVPPDMDPAIARVRFGSIFPNLIPVLSPSDFTYLRIDPIGHDRLKLFARSYDDPALPDLPAIREFRRIAFQRTTEQDLAVVLRTQRGLQAIGLPAGVHASQLEQRIGHFERTWSAAMASYST
ncbi:MAG TPA: aromatic ring-hydroxylating dioxygenase subunit alpha [Kofleriaceae bacterium]|nr:aromatic ring-hydroxylating dioxygenase subunit alpha [Kofleriaceae bacterium]